MSKQPKENVLIMRVFLGMFGAAVITLALVVMYLLLSRDYKLYQAESACVKEYIAQGIERKNIITDKGDCYVKGS